MVIFAVALDWTVPLKMSWKEAPKDSSSSSRVSPISCSVMFWDVDPGAKVMLAPATATKSTPGVAVPPPVE